MALKIRNAEIERLARDIATMTGDSTTGAIRQALRERKARLLLAQGGRERGDRMMAVLQQVWPLLPTGVGGSHLTREQEDETLGFGSDGV
jgi:antitoxin VapB